MSTHFVFNNLTTPGGNRLRNGLTSGCSLTDHLPFIGGQAYAIVSAYFVQGTAAAINPSWSYTPVSIEHAYNDGFKPSSTTTFLLIPGR